MWSNACCNELHVSKLIRFATQVKMTYFPLNLLFSKYCIEVSTHSTPHARPAQILTYWPNNPLQNALTRFRGTKSTTEGPGRSTGTNQWSISAPETFVAPKALLVGQMPGKARRKTTQPSQWPKRPKGTQTSGDLRGPPGTSGDLRGPPGNLRGPPGTSGERP